MVKSSFQWLRLRETRCENTLKLHKVGYDRCVVDQVRYVSHWGLASDNQVSLPLGLIPVSLLWIWRNSLFLCELGVSGLWPGHRICLVVMMVVVAVPCGGDWARLRVTLRVHCRWLSLATSGSWDSSRFQMHVMIGVPCQTLRKVTRCPGVHLLGQGAAVNFDPLCMMRLAFHTILMWSAAQSYFKPAWGVEVV